MTNFQRITSLLTCSSLFCIVANSYAAPADLDLTFNRTGLVANSLRGNAAALDVAIQPDGKIVAVGASQRDFAVTRYNTNGSLDSTFGGDGQVTTDFGGDEQANSVALQSDGKIVLVGYSGGNFALARYNTTGSIDSTFGSGGKVNVALGGVEAAIAVAIQSDGKIVAVGSIDQDVIIARFNTNGSLDKTFAGDGTNRIKHGENEYFNAVSILPDGKIIATGTSIGDGSTNFSGDFILTRFMPNGEIDRSFGTNGERQQGLGGDDRSSDMVLTSNGKILMCGNTNGKVVVARFDSLGFLDASFGSGGKSIASFYGAPSCSGIATDSSGRIVIVGSASGQVYDVNFKVARFTANGALDTTFNNGRADVETTFGQADRSPDYAYAVAIQGDGKIVAVGRCKDDANFAVARYAGNGPITFTINKADSSGGNS